MNSLSCVVSLGVFCTIFFLAGARKALDECEGEQKRGVEWIVQERGPDHGWGKDTHRANIALAVARRKENDIDSARMAIQLELQLTAFLNNGASDEHDLALFVQALLARNRNPRDFHGLDLVGDLLRRVDAQINRAAVHPFLVVTLCDAGAATPEHLKAIQGYLSHRKAESRHMTDMKALALKAYACAASGAEDENREELQKAINPTVTSLISLQNKTDGSFGNAITTALVVQALIASGTKEKWEKAKALQYLDQESGVQGTMCKTYLIVLAQNAEKVKFIKDLYKGKTNVPERGVALPGDHSVTMAVQPRKTSRYSVRTEVPSQWSAFQILVMLSQLNDQFNFTSYPNKDHLQVINSISGIPNNAEANQFWILCREQPNYAPVKHDASPETLVPSDDDTISFYYGESSCPLQNGRRPYLL